MTVMPHHYDQLWCCGAPHRRWRGGEGRGRMRNHPTDERRRKPWHRVTTCEVTHCDAENTFVIPKCQERRRRERKTMKHRKMYYQEQLACQPRVGCRCGSALKKCEHSGLQSKKASYYYYETSTTTCVEEPGYRRWWWDEPSVCSWGGCGDVESNQLGERRSQDSEGESVRSECPGIQLEFRSITDIHVVLWFVLPRTVPPPAPLPAPTSVPTATAPTSVPATSTPTSVPRVAPTSAPTPAPTSVPYCMVSDPCLAGNNTLEFSPYCSSGRAACVRTATTCTESEVVISSYTITVTAAAIRSICGEVPADIQYL